MENKELIIKQGKKEIIFSSLFSDNDMEISIDEGFGEIGYSYLAIDDIIELRNYLNYLITKANQ